GIAAVLTRLGHTVSGSDLKAWRGLERLRLLGVDVHVPHDAACLPADVDAVVVSTAIPPTNPEVVAARERGVPVLRRAEALAAIVDTRRTLAISGTHGKTTTSTMTTLILRAAGWHPSFLIGGEPNEVGSNAAYDDGEWLVVEADESDGTFVEISPEGVILTNVEADHLDHYGDMAALEAACARYLAAAPGPRVACADDPGAARLAAEVSAAGRPVLTYGDSAGADYRIEGYQPLGAGADRLGRRFDLVRRGERRVGAVVQPQRYTRTARLWRDFGDAFGDADVVVLTDVYAAGEPPQPGVSGRLIRQAVTEAHPSGRVLYFPKRADLLARLPELTRPGDLVVTLGAGDITSLPDEWLRSTRRVGGDPAGEREPVPAA